MEVVRIFKVVHVFVLRIELFRIRRVPPSVVVYKDAVIVTSRPDVTR